MWKMPEWIKTNTVTVIPVLCTYYHWVRFLLVFLLLHSFYIVKQKNPFLKWQHKLEPEQKQEEKTVAGVGAISAPRNTVSSIIPTLFIWFRDIRLFPGGTVSVFLSFKLPVYPAHPLMSLLIFMYLYFVCTYILFYFTESWFDGGCQSCGISSG